MSSTRRSDDRGPFPWRPNVMDAAGIVTIFAATRVILVVAGMFAWNVQFPTSTTWRGKDRAGIYYSLVPDNPLLDMWARWDSWEYEEIARKGYWYNFDEEPRPYGTVACFPLYPLAVRAVGRLLGGRYVVAGLVISSLAAIAGFLLLFQWAIWWGDRRSAWVVVSAAITHPVGLFWSALYPQSLYFALSILSLVAMLDGRVAIAGLVGAAVTATRLEGIAILPALLAIYLQKHRWRVGRDVLWLAATPLGLLAYMAYLYHGWGDPVLFLKVHALFGRTTTNPLWTLVEPLTVAGGYHHPSVLMTYATGTMLLLGFAARLTWPILLYGWLLFAIPLSTGVYESIYRVHLVNVPIYLALGLGVRGRWRFLAWGVVLVCLALQTWIMMSWVAGIRLP